MKPPSFVYHAPATVAEAVEALAAAGADGKVLAGGQSLIPLMNMRLAAPGHLVDINHVAGLAGITAEPGGVRVGALARHAEVEASETAHAAQPLVRRALRLVAHPAVRNRGTTVGSIVHADPAAEMPAVLALLDGSVRVRGAEGERDIPAAEFFTGPMESSLRTGELAVSVFFPSSEGGTAIVEMARRHGDYAMAGVAALVAPDHARVACLSVGAVPVVVDVTEAEGDWKRAARLVREQIDPEADIHATADYRRHLTGVLTERALKAAADA